MSDDLYDSLEDECPDGRACRDSFYLHRRESVPIKRVSKLESITRHSLFCFGKLKNKDGSDFSPRYKPINDSHKSNFLPAVNRRKSLQGGVHSLLTKSSDYQALAEKGLLLNEDGSFTRSPRIDGEDLPFITREYKNLVFQKQKIYDLRKNEQKKKLKQYSGKWSGNDKKYANTSLRKSSSSCFCESPLKTNNLTDSMKEVLFQKKHPENISQCSEKFSKQNAKYSLSEIGRPKVNANKCKDSKPLNKHISLIPLITQKPLLSYAERQQLQNGYSPLCLRYGVKKITSETTRSNFGDSVAGKLSEVSSRILSTENLTELEDEENFYKKIMKMEKNKSIKGDDSNFSERTLTSTRRSVTKHGSLKELEKVRETGKTSSKKFSKPLCIDLKIDNENAIQNCKKFSDSLTQFSPKFSKTELVLKGKAYGNLANARNILKFKSQDKLNGRENVTPKFGEDRHLIYRENSGFELRPSRILKKSPQKFSLKRKNDNEQNKQVSIETCTKQMYYGPGMREDKDFYLPHVTTSDHGSCPIKASNLLRMHSYLDDFDCQKIEL